MRTSFKGFTAIVFAAATLSACAVIPEEPVQETEVIVEVPPAPTCYEVAALQKVEIPAETKTVVGISLIENPPYAPIEQRTEQKIVMKQAEVFYVLTDEETGNQTEVTNFCSADVVTGPVGPAPGEALGAPSQG
ncbi:MAG: hypothetical protein ABJO36_02435 [Litorimonas sp.]